MAFFAHCHLNFKIKTKEKDLTCFCVVIRPARVTYLILIFLIGYLVLILKMAADVSRGNLFKSKSQIIMSS